MSARMACRMSGAGNTFLIWEGFPATISRAERPALARFLCDSFTGFYTDGILFLEKDPSGQHHFAWDFFNADGSEAEMCGNAARCVALYFKTRLKGPDQVRFLTKAGTIEADASNASEIRVRMPHLLDTGGPRELTVRGKKQSYFFVNTGVPHVVIAGDPDHELAELVRHAPELGSAGSNVTFVTERENQEVEAVTFERGVEGFTLACGTGAVAAAAYVKSKNQSQASWTVLMPGGALQVEWPSADQPVLSGPAQFEFDLHFPEDKV